MQDTTFGIPLVDGTGEGEILHADTGLSFWGGSRVVAPGGRVAFEAPLLEAGLYTCDIDWDELRRYRVGDPTLRSERLDLTLAELARIHGERRMQRAGVRGLAGWRNEP